VAENIKEFFHNEGIHSTTIQPEFVRYLGTTDNGGDGEDCVLSCPKGPGAQEAPICEASKCCQPAPPNGNLSSKRISSRSAQNTPTTSRRPTSFNEQEVLDGSNEQNSTIEGQPPEAVPLHDNVSTVSWWFSAFTTTFLLHVISSTATKILLLVTTQLLLSSKSIPDAFHYSTLLYPTFKKVHWFEGGFRRKWNAEHFLPKTPIAWLITFNLTFTFMHGMYEFTIM
jgi:hypothetical protein